MGRIEQLVERYRAHIATPWQKNLAGEQKTIFVVYPKSLERRIRIRLPLFEIATQRAGHKWVNFDLTPLFAQWMAAEEYRDIYFEEPDSISMKLRDHFTHHVAEQLRSVLTDEHADDNTIVAVQGAASLYGLTKISLVLKEVVHDIRGRLLLFFPGEYDNNHYRLLDARTDWNYLAVPITYQNGVEE